MNPVFDRKWKMLFERVELLSFYMERLITRDETVILCITENKQEKYFYLYGKNSVRHGVVYYENSLDFSNGWVVQQDEKRRGREEPAFVLQNAFSFLWMDSHVLSRDTVELYSRLKRPLDYSGVSLDIRRMSPGYLPVLPREEELDGLSVSVQYLYEALALPDIREAFKSLPPDNMMIVKKYSSGVWAHNEKKLQPLGYTPECTKKYDIQRYLTQFDEIVLRDSCYEIDWSYLPDAYRAIDGSAFVPRMLLAVDKTSGNVLRQAIIKPQDNVERLLMDEMMALVIRYGKPSVAYVGSKDLYVILISILKPLDIQIVFNDNLPELDAARVNYLNNV